MVNFDQIIGQAVDKVWKRGGFVPSALPRASPRAAMTPSVIAASSTGRRYLGCTMDYQTVSATHYRNRARKMRRLAEDETAQDVRDELLQLADDYDRIALLAAEGEGGAGV